MNEEEKFNKMFEGKTIKRAEIDGFEITMDFDDGTTFIYEATDGGYSHYNLYKNYGEDSQVALG